MALGSTVSIRRHKGHPTHKWLCTFKDGDKRVRRYFRRKQDAEGFAEKREVEAEATGTATLSASEKAAVVAARDELSAFGLSVQAALGLVLAQKRQAEQSCSIQELTDTVIGARRREGKSPRYISDLESRLGQFCRQFGERKVAEVSADDVSGWLLSLNVAATTQLNFRRVLVVLFNEGVKRKFCSGNPAADAIKPKATPGETGILTVAQLARLLGASPDALIPYVAIGAFAGLRRSELERLDWAQVDFEAGLIEVTAENAKSSRRRYVKVSDNLAEWLLPHARPAGGVTTSNYRDLLGRAREQAGIAWPSNALRHTFASAHLAAFENAADTSLQLGHTNASLVFQHYRHLLRPKEAMRYWELRPSSKSNVISLRA